MGRDFLPTRVSVGGEMSPESSTDGGEGRDPQRSVASMPGIMSLAWPAVVGNLAYSVVGLVDIKIVASLGSSAVAAVTTGHRIFWVTQAVMIAVTAGTTALVARAWGAGDRAEAARVAPRWPRPEKPTVSHQDQGKKSKGGRPTVQGGFIVQGDVLA